MPSDALDWQTEMSTDYLFLAQNLAFVDEVYSQYKRDPNAVDPSWRRAFDGGPPTNGSNGVAYQPPTNGAPSVATLARAGSRPSKYARRSRVAVLNC